MNEFELFKGKTLYQGQADVSVTVYDMRNHSHLLWDRHLGEILYPTNSGIPAQDKPEQQFEREFVNVVATRIAENFYKHDANSDFRDRCAGESLRGKPLTAPVGRGGAWRGDRFAAAVAAGGGRCFERCAGRRS